MLRNGKETRHKISECSRCVIFPHGGGEYQSMEFLKSYCGFSKKLAQKVMNIKSRWVCMSNTYNKYVLYDKGCFLVSKLNADLEKQKAPRKIIIPRKPLRFIETDAPPLDNSDDIDSDFIISD